MKYPIRHESHIAETASYKLLDACIPDTWLVRHASERDYGIDLLVEPVRNDGAVTGELLALQVKATKSLSWSASGEHQTAKFRGTKTATVNYWMGLPVPVFLCVCEHETNRCYFAAAKSQVRKRYLEFKSQETFSFLLSSVTDLSAPDGIALMLLAYFHEQNYTRLARALTDLLSGRDSYIDYMLYNHQRDPFLEVPQDKVLQLVALYSNLQVVASATQMDWDIPSLEDYFAKDRQRFEHEYMMLHEQTQAEVIYALAPRFLQGLQRSVQLVATTEADYWIEHNYLLWSYVSADTTEWVDEARTRLQWLLPASAMT